MSDYERCAELCDDRGFARQAALLREIGAGRGRAYVVVAPRGMNDESEWDESGEPEPERGMIWMAFLDREAAESFAREMSARALRGFVAPFVLHTGHAFRYVTSLSRAEFCSRVSEILGRPYQLPTAREPLIPESATDAQLLRIVPLLNLEFCRIVAVDIAP